MPDHLPRSSKKWI